MQKLDVTVSLLVAVALAADVALLTLAVVTLTVTPLHHTPRPCPVVTPGPLDDRLVVLQAQSLRSIVCCVDDESFG